MADSTAPLLSQVDSEPQKEEKHHPTTRLEETIERCVGDLRWTQLFQAILVSFACAFDSQQTFISVFTDATPKWHCTQPNDQSCQSTTTVCQLPKAAWDWDMPADSSIISQWSLECAGSLTTGLPASSFLVGCLTGGILLATLADSSLGRKNMLLLSCLLMSTTGLLTVFSNSIWIYSILRFLSGFGRATIGTCALVLPTELVGQRWRGKVSIIGFFCFTIGFLSLPAIAYLNQGSSWRVMYLWTCIPALLYCLLVHFLVQESPRWLYVKGRKEEFVATLKSIAPQASYSSLSLSFFGTPVDEDLSSDLYSAIKRLLEKSWAIRRLMAVMVAAIGIGTVYYGMPLGLSNLSFNLYLSTTLNALSELPSALLSFFVIGRLSRKTSLLFLTTASGICSVMCAVVRGRGSELQIWLEMVSFFCGCTAINVLLIYTLELFPTCVRNSAVAMTRQALVLGGVFSPMLVAAGRKNEFVSYGVFGLAIGLCGLFVVGLPETRGETLSDTMDEAENKDRAAGRLENSVF